MTSVHKTRRKPSQSRAWMTSIAIQDAFVIGLLERGYAQVSIRDIASIAGVGLGTLYLYFPNKESIAAVTIRRWLRHLLRAIERSGKEPHATVQLRCQALVQHYLDEVLPQARAWQALVSLERSITEPQLYRQMYTQFVQAVAGNFQTASDWPPGRDPFPVAFLAFSLLCSAVRDALLVLDMLPERAPWQQQLEQAVGSAVACAMAAPPNTAG
ncbi:TetR/AcrR family transcriptional regulator [Lampropedia aestuarii]|uniref:TetR/AcrR family transcriptional regulator n=1 Tax=Lampropedia aestuarii TaxID=2562762 RepID=A0A4S5BRD0_9BURK|nr:TetR/AcrR family transcriptional regulator [Lampropedia aestuarii]MDH5858119.1 TetR/AcrR family transcriptional regulator [Lampropedia aestuarii]THJ33753.1 TetR/AcrR family transcriptional regulator [Lampropedia aestuarii]